MTKKKIVLLIAIFCAFVFVCLQIFVSALCVDAAVGVVFDFLDMTEDEIYNAKKDEDPDALVEEIIALEGSMPTNDDKMALLPHLTALIDMGDEFTEDALIALIKDERTGVAIENAFVEMYVNKGADPSKLLALLYDDTISENTKALIVSMGDYSAEALSVVFEAFDGMVATTAMKKLCVKDASTAYELAITLFDAGLMNASESKQKSAFLGVAAYFENDNSQIRSPEKERVITEIMDVFYASSDETVKSKAITALARMSDYELFASLIENDDIERYSKITVIQRNVDTVTEKISESRTEEDISSVITAMKLHPIIEVGEALDAAVKSGKMENTENIQGIIKHIANNGINGVY